MKTKWWTNLKLLDGEVKIDKQMYLKFCMKFNYIGKSLLRK